VCFRVTFVFVGISMFCVFEQPVELVEIPNLWEFKCVFMLHAAAAARESRLSFGKVFFMLYCHYLFGSRSAAHMCV
jgi:hypothetical protein